MRDHPFEYIISNASVSELNHAVLLQHSSEPVDTSERGFYDIQPKLIGINSGIFIKPGVVIPFPEVIVSQIGNSLVLHCGCNSHKNKLCAHQVQVLYNIMDREYLRIFFDNALRRGKMKLAARDYGLENESNPDDFFQIEYTHKAYEIKPKIKELYPVNKASILNLAELILPKKNVTVPPETVKPENAKTILVFSKHKYFDQCNVELYNGLMSRDGKVKNPLTDVDPQSLIWKTNQIDEVKFYSAVAKFQSNYTSTQPESDIEGLKVIVKNPLQMPVFYHDTSISDNITANSILPVKLHTLPVDLRVSVDRKGNFYEITGELVLNDKPLGLKQLKIKYNYFLLIGDTLQLVVKTDVLRIIDFFNKNNQKILIHPSKYDEFQQNILSKLEHQISIRYSFVKPATKKQIEEQGFDRTTERVIYLSDSEDFVYVTPVMRYGNVEIPVFSRKQIYDTDQNGNVFTVDRDNEAETQFTSLVIRQHPDFEEQLHDMEYFYLHKVKFLDENWFLNAFEEWKNRGIIILGFNELKNNKLNPNKATVLVSVSSGIDWFNTSLVVHYGKQKASLKQLHKSIRNKSKYVQLDDGTLGILPEEWIKKFASYFHQGEIAEEAIRTPKINFTAVRELYNEEVLSVETKEEIALYAKRFAAFESIKEIAVPDGLHATLRHYQMQGLNWLNFLDEFNFGGCLADDMGLGKTIQIIAFILSQRTKQQQNTNLVVVPTSLLFNWQAEVAKFAPSIGIFTYYGTNKIKDRHVFDTYEIVLTTYGMLLSDIRFLKEYRFNYIFLDESQTIKNPESQRYKATRMLQSRNKIVLTGTPIENNTFDIYGQLSFACPGLFGNKQDFKDIYSTPIDKFANSTRAKELQQKINPFILRRTKKQVATELPEKTEMVIYCEMGEEQRRVYDFHEKELRDYIASKKEDDIVKDSMHVLTGITKLRQICNSPALLNDEKYLGDYSSEIDVLMEQIESQSPGHKILVFSQFVAMLELIKKKLESANIPFVYLTGQTKDRAAKVNEFQNNDNVRVFLISLKAGGTGLNLTEADYVYLVDPWWNPAVENQAIDRSHRIGQKNHVIAVRLICPDSIEEKIRKLQESKTDLANDLIKTDTSVLKSLTKKDLIGLLQK